MSTSTTPIDATVSSATTTAAATAVAKQVSDSFAFALDNVPDVAKPVVGKQRNPSMNKVGHKCCGGCCDVRRAVIIVNSIYVAFGFLGLLTALLGRHVAGNADKYSGQDGYDDAAFAELQNIPWVWIFISSIVHLLIAIGGIYGGLKYHAPLVGLCGIMYAVDAIFSLGGLNFWSFLTSALFAYPHYFLVHEIRQGIMTPENYHNEEHSCCCV